MDDLFNNIKWPTMMTLIFPMLFYVVAWIAIVVAVVLRKSRSGEHQTLIRFRRSCRSGGFFRVYSVRVYRHLAFGT